MLQSEDLREQSGEEAEGLERDLEVTSLKIVHCLEILDWGTEKPGHPPLL